MTGAKEQARVKSLNPPVHVEWTPERVDMLRELVAQGDLSFEEIAARIGGGVTRNAAIGKAHRLKIATHRRRAARKKVERYVRNPRVAKPASPVAQSAVTVAPEGPFTIDPAGQRRLSGSAWQPLPGTTPVPLLALVAGQCKWPIGDPKLPGFGFCGMQAEGSVYCASHQRLSVRRPE